ncbi:MAG: nitrite reductase [Desulfurivibrionaceae bacterium]
MDVTILLPAGRLPLEVMTKAGELARKNDLRIYLSTLQNLRLLDVPEDKVDEIKQELRSMGLELKGPGKFPVPKVCIGQGHCNLGRMDPEELSGRLLGKFGDRSDVKQKLKIAVSACPLCCSGGKLTDIGIVATKNGYELYAGGKGGPNPRIGRRILKDATEDEVLEAFEKVFDFHQKMTDKKQRMAKLVDHEDFPYPEEV